MKGLKELKQLYEKCCEEYAKRMCSMYGWSYSDGWWVSDDIGGVFCTSDIEYSLGMEDIRLIVDSQLSYSDFIEWWEYNMYNDKNINLYSWIKGYRGQ